MRHRVEKRKLGRTSSHRLAMLRNLVTSLLDKERVETTHAKAKELRRVTDRMITLGKRGDLASRRQALRIVRSQDVVKKLFSDIAVRFESRPGGYTRIFQIGPRVGDGASMALIELVDRPAITKEADKKKSKDSASKKK